MTADSLGYLTLEGLGTAVGDRERNTFCTACFTGKYLTGNLSVSVAAGAGAAPKLATA